MLASTLEKGLDQHAAAKPQPGARTFQRLNRAEYERSIKDLLTLDIHARLVARLDDEAASTDAANEGADDVEEAEEIGAGPLTLAIDVNEEAPPAEGATTPA